MTTITRERLTSIVFGAKKHPGSFTKLEIELAHIALASLTAEPVAYIFKHPAGKLFWALTDESNKDQADVMPVYAAPQPAPVVPVMYKGIELLTKDGLELIRDGVAEATGLEAMCMAEALLSVQTDLVVPPKIEPDYEVITAILPTANPDEYACCIAADMWNACRAAMVKQPSSKNDAACGCQLVPKPQISGQDDITSALELLKQRLVECNRYNYCADAVDSLERATKAAMYQIESVADAPDTWIPVSERMPLTPYENCLYEDVEVQVFAGGDVFIAHYAIGALPEPWGAWLDTAADITHWQPLAAAPREKTE